MKIRIFQINPGRDKYRVLFLAYEFLQKFQGTPDVDSAIYDMVFEEEVAADDLEGIYRIFNTNQVPTDYHGRSMSVSDVVQVLSGGKEEPGFYFCNNIGFKKILFQRNVVM